MKGATGLLKTSEATEDAYSERVIIITEDITTSNYFNWTWNF